MQYNNDRKHLQRFVMPLEHKRKPAGHFTRWSATPSV